MIWSMCGCISETIKHNYEYYLRQKGVLTIWHIFSLIDMIINTIFSNYPNFFKIGVVQQ